MLVLVLSRVSLCVSGFAVSMGEAAETFLFQGVLRSCDVVLPGMRGTLWHSMCFRMHLCARQSWQKSRNVYGRICRKLSFSRRHKKMGRRSTPHSTLHTAHPTLYTPHFTLHTPPFTLYTPHVTFTLYTPHTLHFTLHNPHSPRHTLNSTLHTLHSTHFTLHNPPLYTLHTTLYVILLL